MKQSLLEIVQTILSKMDSEHVNSIADSDEAGQIARIVKDTFYDIVSARNIPEHDRLLKLTALSDITRPTHFKYPANLKVVQTFEYNNKQVLWKDPVQFLNDMANPSDNNTLAVSDPISGATLYVRNDKDPNFYTSFDNEYIVCNSYDSSVDNSLQESKTRCWGTILPTFLIQDDFIPDIDDVLSQYLLQEATSTALSLYKSGSDPKIEQSARRLKSFMQNDKYKTGQPKHAADFE
jgi:hypothetical protein